MLPIPESMLPLRALQMLHQRDRMSPEATGTLIVGLIFLEAPVRTIGLAAELAHLRHVICRGCQGEIEVFTKEGNVPTVEAIGLPLVIVDGMGILVVVENHPGTTTIVVEVLTDTVDVKTTFEEKDQEVAH